MDRHREAGGNEEGNNSSLIPGRNYGLLHLTIVRNNVY